MKQTTSVVITALISSTLSFSSLASSSSALSPATNKVEINWTNAEHYRDLRSTTETKQATQRRFFKEMGEYLNHLSTQLPDGYKLALEVTQVDLAGRIRFVNGQQVRIVKDIDYPNMAFSYRLTAPNGQLIKAETAQVKGKRFLLGAQHQPHKLKPFAYEKKMIEAWFDKHIVPQI
ncbi:DUF3016 domain-containing protein [Thalassotalea euphylliae]|uniref:DUF3016 domain-containing protein n=1 Tax=Thalassotalea euphylliae TaxID=1655234 RepID=A0A3E0TVK0_9GAMM|nr:DUF3016 domain-containing protein [Thalassotalea euphylliae]REL28383.1 DUF3016 domain-containing protein [Thalassotalea euphylliae]